MNRERESEREGMGRGMIKDKKNLKGKLLKRKVFYKKKKKTFEKKKKRFEKLEITLR